MRKADVILRGGQVLMPDGELRQTEVRLSEGRILGIGPGPGDVDVDLDGRLLLPGIVDLHGDGFEGIVQPRPETMIDLPVALHETDRQLVANGVTTAYYGLSWTWESNRGLRSGQEPARFLEIFEKIGLTLHCEARLHLRFEIHHLDVLETVLDWVERGRVDLLAFNDHLTYMEEKAADPQRLELLAARNRQTPAQYLAEHQAMRDRIPQAKAGVERLAAAGVRAGIPMASHDEETPEIRDWYHDLGCRICEFPVNEPTALRALELGDEVVLGAPNAIRGASLYKRLSARCCSQDGICTVLASDYYYPSQLHAAMDLYTRHGMALGKAWGLISAGPARALGLADRGRIEAGLRADLVAVETDPAGLPRVACTWSQGRAVHLGGHFASQALAGRVPVNA